MRSGLLRPSVSMLLVVAAGLLYGVSVPAASAACPGCQVGPYRGNYGYGFGYHNPYARTTRSFSRISHLGRYRQPFGIAHPRSLIGRSYYGYSYATARYGNPVGRIGNPSIYRRYPTRGRITNPSYFFRYPTRGRITNPSYFMANPSYHDSGSVHYIATDQSAVRAPADQGWLLLGDGLAFDAAAAFDRRLNDNPGNMVAKAGLSLSLAAAGDLTAGAWHMRQAFGSDANVLQSLRLNRSLRHQLHELIRSYRKALTRNNANRQKLFMLASLHYLSGDRKAAANSIAAAIRNGDRTPAARRLMQLIERDPVGRIGNPSATSL